MGIGLDGKKAIKWSVLDKFLKRGVQFIISIFLARLLSPDDFGVVAMAAIFVGWGEVFRDFGLGQALVQRKDIKEIHSSTIFYLNIMMGVLIAAILFLIAPLAADFYGNEMVAWVVRVAGITFFINAFNVVQNSLLTKNLNYKIGTVASFIASILSGCIGITLAYCGFGVWSLLTQSIMSALITSIYIWLNSDWRPKAVFSFKETKPLFRKGVGFMGQGLVDNIFNYAGTMVIGKMFSPGILGIYDRGQSLVEMTNTTFVLPVTRPFFPMFSKLQDNLENMRNYYMHTLLSLNWLLILITGIFLSCSNEIIILLLGEKWIPSIEYFFLLSWIIPFYANWAITTSLWKGLGLVKKVTFITFFEKSLYLLSIPALFISLKSYAICIVLSNIIANILKAILNARITGISVWIQYKEWFFEMCIVSSLIFIVNLIYLDSLLISLLIKSLIILTTYVSLSFLFRVEGIKTYVASIRVVISAKFKR